ncbi:MAG: HAMP domain-containing sensor histidine kinase, partial [Patescibacteria group bacterium]|nr:HAMP domain-containing sensor histidine kinase [Patescibacteria group bacterium]
RIEYNCLRFDVIRIIIETSEEMLAEVTRHGLTMEFPGAATTPLMAWVDPDKFHEVLVNLVDNSLKHTREGSIKISAESSADGRSVIVRVKDTGSGMTPSALEQVFQKYARRDLDGSAGSSGMSLGLGLYICAEFMRGMGGDIRVEQTALGKGTTIALVMPVEPAGECLPPKEEGKRVVVLGGEQRPDDRP